MSTSGATILIVDDNAANRALAKATLDDEGFETLVASSAEEAFAIVEARHPHCILMDIRMPGVGGTEACEHIRKLPGGDDIAIVFVTAIRDVAVFDQAIAVGGDDFITKPFQPDELVIRVRTAIRLRRIASERSEAVEQLQRQRNTLKRLELQKEQLVAFLVHDLKNPVHNIDLHAQLIERSGELAKAHTAAGRIRGESRALARMITNLLDISRADEGLLQPSLAEIDTASLVRDVLDELQPRANVYKVNLESQVHVGALVADRDLLARVLSNLVENAIRHSPEGGSVRLSVAASADGIELRVADSGRGVPPTERELVFERFRSGPTVDGTNRGLGLTFCKLAVEAHGGRIWVEDAAPGAIFCVRLVMAQSPCR